MLTEGRTFFVIAHRLSTIKNANLILTYPAIVTQNKKEAGLFKPTSLRSLFS